MEKISDVSGEFSIKKIIEESKKYDMSYSNYLGKKLASDLYKVINESEDSIIDKIEEVKYLINLYSSEECKEVLKPYETSESENKIICGKILLNLQFLLRNLYNF